MGQAFTTPTEWEAENIDHYVESIYYCFLAKLTSRLVPLSLPKIFMN